MTINLFQIKRNELDTIVTKVFGIYFLKNTLNKYDLYMYPTSPIICERLER